MSLFNKKLKDKLKKIEVKTEAKKRNNRNEKIGMNKYNNYTPAKYACRKTCATCGSINHLSTNCKYVYVQNSSIQMPISISAFLIPVMLVMPNMLAKNTHVSSQYANMSYYTI